ncbi:uncharacterized protein KGF55_005595 [Candida pseudojiufengensis]|uniref:uncharacterized protein n=1 Tax=Candida pseudojiufengensis TaxID=497109 RepID=UPI002224011C|nr:uncharacterized protein KGF55_005595 [Candida pseudojiufengensis]KAI5958941.1 hypothetical protein KGF55_005595 [Candida pseudojiufengensis]
MANHYIIFGRKVPTHVLAITTLGLLAGSIAIPPLLGIKDEETKTKAAKNSPHNIVQNKGEQKEVNKLEKDFSKDQRSNP